MGRPRVMEENFKSTWWFMWYGFHESSVWVQWPRFVANKFKGPGKGNHCKIFGQQRWRSGDVKWFRGKAIPWVSQVCNGINARAKVNSDTQNESIDLCGRRVLKSILKEREDAIYFSVISDATSDISHTEQNDVLIRYVKCNKEANSWKINKWCLEFKNFFFQKDRKWDSRNDWKFASWQRDRHWGLQRAGFWQWSEHVGDS